MTGYKGLFTILFLAIAVCAFLPISQGAPQEEGSQEGGQEGGSEWLNFKKN